MTVTDLCELDVVDEMRRVWTDALTADVAVSRALAAEWEPAPMSTIRCSTTTRSGRGPVTACQIASGSPDRHPLAVRRDLRLAGATALVLAPLFPLLARGGWQ